MANLPFIGMHVLHKVIYNIFIVCKMTVIYTASNESNERLSRRDPAQNPWGNAKNVLKIIG